MLTGVLRFINALGGRIVEIHPLIARIASVATERLEREHGVAVTAVARQRILSSTAMVDAAHAKRAHHTVERDIQIVHDGVERLSFPIRINKGKKSRDGNEHDDSEERR